MRSLCLTIDAILGNGSVEATTGQRRELAVLRHDDPYFQAFKDRCLQWVYGDDPRHKLERETTFV